MYVHYIDMYEKSIKNKICQTQLNAWEKWNVFGFFLKVAVEVSSRMSVGESSTQADQRMKTSFLQTVEHRWVR